jgi:hypothetical protein
MARDVKLPRATAPPRAKSTNVRRSHGVDNSRASRKREHVKKSQKGDSVVTPSTTPVGDKPKEAAPLTVDQQKSEIQQNLEMQRFGSVQSKLNDEATAIEVQSAIGSRKVGELTQRVQRVSTSHFLSVHSQKVLERLYPHLMVVPKAHGIVTHHDHPILNIERELGEEAAYSYAKKVVQGFATTGKQSPTIIVDIGGNPSRHARKNRHDVHSCNPILDSADVIRSLHHQLSSPHSCCHLAQDCKCVQPAIHMSIHSLYNLDVSDVATLCMSNSTHTLVALVHTFPDAYGAFADGEATYQQVSVDQVAMTVRGNEYSYTHNNMHWLRSNSSPVMRDDVRIGTLCWSAIQSFPHSVLYAFHVTHRIVESVAPAQVSFSSAMLSPTHYGPVRMSALNEKASVNTGGEQLSLPDVKVWSWGSFVMITKSSNAIEMMCPKGFISECATRVAGMVRSPDNFRNLLAWAKFQCARYNVPPHLMSSCLFAVCNLAFVQDLHFETAVMHGLIEPVKEVIAVHENALNRKFKWVWTHGQIAACVTASAATLTATGIATHALGLASGPVAGITLAVAGVATMAAAVIRQYSRPSNIPRDEFAKYRANRASNAPRTAVIPLPRGTQLPATDPVKPIDVLLDPVQTPLDEVSKAKIEAKNPHDNREPENAPHRCPGPASDPKPNGDVQRGLSGVAKQAMPLRPGGIVTDFSIPVVPSNSSHSSISAITERILKAGPLAKGQVKMDLWAVFRTWVFNNLSELGLHQGCVRRCSFDDWNVKYGAAQQAVHQRARDDLDVIPHRVPQRGMFTKIESLMKSDGDGVAKLAPRGIQSGTPNHNVVTGPFCKSFSRRLKTAWDIHQALGLAYTSGATAEEIGAAFKTACDRHGDNLSILEGDYERFDSTIHRLFLELERDVYAYTGASAKEQAAFSDTIFTRGRDKFGNKYEIDGGRHSGDHNTSCGNSLLQGLAKVFSIAVLHSHRHGVALPSYQELVYKYEFLLLLLGDDSLLVASKELTDLLGPQAIHLCFLLRSLGLVLEPKIHHGPTAKWDASFCSSRFYPVKSGKVVLAPGVGRGLAKSGWYVDIPLNMPIERLVRGDAIAKNRDLRFVPFLRHMWAKNLELTKQFAGKEVLSQNLRRSQQHNFHASETHEPCDETYRMVESLYGLTKADEEKYAVMLKTVTTLPVIVTMEAFAKAAAVDGVATDHDADGSDEAMPALDSEEYEQELSVHVNKLYENYGLNPSMKGLVPQPDPYIQALSINAPLPMLGAIDEGDEHGDISLIWDS